MQQTIVNTAPQLDMSRELLKVHADLLRHKATCLFAGVILRGENKIVTDGSVQTACTDGKNKYYGEEFFRKLSPAERRGLVMHENLHDALMHMLRDSDLRSDSQVLWNVAADYSLNGTIVQWSREFPAFIKLPEGGLYDSKFDGWSVRQVYNYLKKECKQPDSGSGKKPQPQGGSPGDGSSQGGDPYDGVDEVQDKTGKKYRLTGGFDEHDAGRGDALDIDGTKEEMKEVREALQQGGLLAGLRGSAMPRAITDVLTPSVSWSEVLRDFITEWCKGRDAFDWSRLNIRRYATDIIAPQVVGETIGELIVGIDVSGSIDKQTVNRFAAEIALLCEQVEPSSVRVIYWHTEVSGEQVFEPGQYPYIASLLKPNGCGGTRAGCVAEYIKARGLAPEAVVMLTDGYLETPVDWRIDTPTLWVIKPDGSMDFTAPGVRVQMD